MRDITSEQKDFLIIDSHKSAYRRPCTNLHWLNADLFSNLLDADLIWSYNGVNDNIKSGYKKIIFNHSSQYCFVDRKWLDANPEAELYFITNDYALGESKLLWRYMKDTNKKINVIANHDKKGSKVVKKNVNNWYITNLNSLIYNHHIYADPVSKSIDEAVYWGTYRRNRELYFKKYITSDVILSTHSKNIEKFSPICSPNKYIKRIDWANDGLKEYAKTLYIEDEMTHIYYSCLATRFYESISYWSMPIFTEECRNTIIESGYPIENVIKDSSELKDIKYNVDLIRKYREIAKKEKLSVIGDIQKILLEEV